PSDWSSRRSWRPWQGPMPGGASPRAIAPGASGSSSTRPSADLDGASTKPKTPAGLKQAYRASCSALAACSGIGLEEPMQMDDEVAHMRVVHGLLRLGAPGTFGRVVVWEKPHDIELVEIAERHLVQRGKFPAEHQVQQL